MPIDTFSRDILTFTFPDSMTSLPFGTSDKHSHERKPYHGKVFTWDQIIGVVEEFGLPDRNRVVDRFIEVQVWDERPILDFMKRHSLVPLATANHT